LNVARMLVASLLIASVVVAFIYGPPLDIASAAVTSYSTWTSAYTSYWSVVTGRSTEWKTTTVEVLTQTEYKGPCLRMDIKFYYWYYPGSQEIVEWGAVGYIENLMSVPVKGITIVSFIGNKAGSVKETVEQRFGRIEPGKGINLLRDDRVQLKNVYRETDFQFSSWYVIIHPEGYVQQTPAATYTMFARTSGVYMSTYTMSHIVTETVPFEGFGVGSIVAIVAIVAIAISAIIFFKRRQRIPSGTIQPQVGAEATVPSQKYCMACGAKIPSDSEYCDECGVKQA